MYLQWFNSDIYSGTYGKNSCIFIFIYSSTYSGIYKETNVFTVVFMEKTPCIYSAFYKKITHVFDFLGKYLSKKMSIYLKALTHTQSDFPIV
jgi:hypothetical protein